MLNIFNLQLLRLKREPLLAISFLVMTLVFVFFIVGSGGEQTLTIQTYSEELSESEMGEWIDRLNETEAFNFEIQDRDTIEEEIRMNQISFALELNEDGYQYLVGQESQFLMAVDQHVEKVYRTYLTITEVNQQFPDGQVVEKDFIEIESRSLSGLVSNSEESSAHTIIGMTLFFSIFTILFGLMNIAIEKRTGTWDRLISTPLRKGQIYTGQLLHYFLIGVFQILICFIVFNQLFNYDFGSQYFAIIISVIVYVFTIVSLGMLIIGLVKSPQQLQAVIPIVATGSAMLGGAYWPLEIVSNKIIAMLGKLTPIYYGMESLKGAILFDRGVLEILQPLSILLFMGVLFMGIGLNLMEGRR